jgi:PPOX class probable FMN-dependent enzyme
MSTNVIGSVDELRRLYAEPGERAVRKQLARLDRHGRRFIELSPFVVIASAGAGGMDASPRGGEPGFIRVVDEVTVAIPDAPGNNRLDTLENLLVDSRVGLFFMIPGVDETLRVNGAARLTTDPDRLRALASANWTPKLVIEVAVEQAYLHCAKALMRSRLWAAESQRERSVLPTIGEMLREQIGSTDPAESQESMLARYRRDL